ncbi:MAG TPA: hypothetical protein VFV33_09430 [Gemmatimonadaceae bacterium]|nr:hypothetical protein [Gemmatimonadaceae bacterium]
MLKTIAGEAETLPSELVTAYPELAALRLRRGGLPPRIGGWCLGQSTVAGITLWRTVWLGREARASAELLLHELRHVHQFASVRAFPLRYVWESLRRGYQHNRFEVEARHYAMARARPTLDLPSSQDV